jgi:glycerol-3-phosphate acyltransferase PlsY
MTKIFLALLLPPLFAVYLAVVALSLDTDEAYTQYLLIIPTSYFLGSIPWGFLITLAVKGVDIRQYGSGRIGTSNVLRTTGGPFAVLALALDLSKGLMAVVLARVVVDTPSAEVAAGLAALAGHNWSVFLGFRGGRGIVTGVGGLLIMEPIAAGIAMATFTPITLFTRYLSLGSIISVVVAFLAHLAITLLDHAPTAYLFYTGIGGAIIICQHRDNLRRLIQGTERRLGQRADRIGEAPSPGMGGG